MSGPEQRWLALWRSEVERHIVGDPTPVTELMLTLLAGGHALLESAPGLGKPHWSGLWPSRLVWIWGGCNAPQT